MLVVLCNVHRVEGFCDTSKIGFIAVSNSSCASHVEHIQQLVHCVNFFCRLNVMLIAVIYIIVRSCVSDMTLN